MGSVSYTQSSALRSLTQLLSLSAVLDVATIKSLSHVNLELIPNGTSLFSENNDVSFNNGKLEIIHF